MALQLSFSIDDQCTTISITGSLNEYSSALDEVDVNPEFDLNIDLKGVTAINSLGVRNFNAWIHKIKCAKLRLFYCPRSFITQLNLIDDFVPEKAEIESFFVPYFSEKSGEEANALFTKYLEYKKVDGAIVLNLPVMLDSQGEKMDLDIMRDQYFRFLNKYY